MPLDGSVYKFKIRGGDRTRAFRDHPINLKGGVLSGKKHSAGNYDITHIIRCEHLI